MGYKECMETEKKGLAELIPFIEKVAYQGRFTILTDGPMAKLLQEVAGDAVINLDADQFRCVDLKVEEQNVHGNFYLETWSNRKWFTLGWMFKSSTDYLLYYFLDTKELFSIPFHKLKTWAFIDGRIYAYPEKPQVKHSQPNDGWGRCVPIEVIYAEVGFKYYKEGIRVHGQENLYSKRQPPA